MRSPLLRTPIAPAAARGLGAALTLLMAGQVAACATAAPTGPDPRAAIVAAAVVAELAATPEAMMNRLAVVLEAIPEDWYDEDDASSLLRLEPTELEPVEPGDFFIPETAELPALYVFAREGETTLYTLLSLPGVRYAEWPVVEITSTTPPRVVAAGLRDFLAARLEDPPIDDSDPELEGLWRLRRVAMWQELQLGIRNPEARAERLAKAALDHPLDNATLVPGAIATPTPETLETPVPSPETPESAP